MEITGIKQLAVAQQQVWEALHDAELLMQLIDGCESLEWASGSTLTGSVLKKIGPVKASYDIELEITNEVHPKSYTISGSAKSKAQGFASGIANVTLAETEEGCEVIYDAELKIGGKIAQLGSRLMKGTSRKVIDGFFGKLEDHLLPDSQNQQ